jgi:DNA-binding transcriptional MocR family regulator
MAWAVKQKTGNSGQKLVLLMLANFTNYETGQCNPSHNRLADQCCMSVASIKRHIDDLENAGLLKKVHTFKDNIQKSNQYILALPGSSIWTTPQLTMSPTPAQFELQKQEVKQEKNNILSISNHLFEVFWKSYPRKTNKSFAKRVFDKLKVNDELLKKMLYAIEAQKRSIWKDKDPQYIPHPSTWLNGERWEDEVAVVSSVPKGLAGGI